MHHRECIQTRPWWRRPAEPTRFIADRFLPDKAVDLMDEAASAVRCSWTAAPRRSTSASAARCSCSWSAIPSPRRRMPPAGPPGRPGKNWRN
ncbi:MAG: hypothetical protein IPN91_13920 [Holophagaceae bacterium]|uniref:ClpA/ClpB AAA lid domain-containing protein n=1 Tax=Candidatus Geothrix odensensis TaxID=2954440 RepID=A0A936F429_9BACT|nr:hypothetical protein [Candidatus Geothrix odensensis]